ncbi:MAG: enolase C-terminal domain-like protein, partial [Thermoguttaceae bacterium]
TRRTFLKAAAAAVAGSRMSWKEIALASEGSPLLVRDAKIICLRDRKGGATDTYLEITSESGLRGYAGPLLKEQVAAFPANLRELLAGRDAADPGELNFATLWAACHPGNALESYARGKDPLTGATAWGIKRKTRHSETGWVITALSAMDLALWDLRGKAAGRPVWRLLRAKRQRLNAYASMLGYSVKPTEARNVARTFFDQGFKQQKWFFMSGPADGAEGLKQNIELVRALREELGAGAMLMFDGIQYVWKSADHDHVIADYAITLAKGILPYKPHWLEEPLRPDDLEGYTRVKGETGIVLAAGEHWYTRWNVKPFLDRKIVSFVQSDPEWCGGISEWLKIYELARAYPGVQVIPHGHHVLAASNCVASQPETICPMLEYLIQSRIQVQHCQTRPMVAAAGTFAMAEEPGLGPSLDEARMERL